MSRRKELAALLIALMVAIAFLVFQFSGPDRPTVPVDRVDEQNSGANAPHEVLPSPDSNEAAE
jgi:hypothetical protein